ncbi:MAG: GNAT family N-acetyltransferase [Candidatus Dormibacteraceae bacterium]
MVLEGKKVRLRGLVPADETALIAILSDPEVTRGLDLWALRPIGRPDVTALLRPGGPSLVRWGVEDRVDGALAGIAWLTDIEHRDRHADLQLVLGPPARWRRGLGREAAALATAFAFAHLSLLKVSAEIPVTLPAGRRTAEQAGFAREGTLRRNRLFDGELVDVDAMAAFADEPRWVEAARWT